MLRKNLYKSAIFLFSQTKAALRWAADLLVRDQIKSALPKIFDFNITNNDTVILTEFDYFHHQRRSLALLLNGEDIGGKK